MPGIAPVIGGRGSGLNRVELMHAAQGLLTENYPRQDNLSTSIMIGGTAYAMLVGLRAGDLVTNAYVHCQAVATLPTLFKAGLYSADGTKQLAVSADQHALFTSTGVKTIPLTTPFTVLADGGYYVVLVATATTTLPTLYRGSTTSLMGAIGSNVMPFATAGTALSDLPAAPASYSAASSPIGHWVGVG